jgi:RimJ/RimL family protein N-acetyltransferase
MTAGADTPSPRSAGLRTEAVLPFRFETPLVTDRLVLRLMRLADVDAVHAYQSREDVCRYLLFEPRSRDLVAERVAEHARADRLATDGDHLRLALVLGEGEERAGTVIGDSSFGLSSVEHARGEIGWTMHPDFSGRGYATEAARAVLELAFATLRLHRVVAELDPRNDASVAMCRRLGMREEAHFVRDWWFKGEWADTGVYAILRQEWLGGPTPEAQRPEQG